MAVLTSNSLMRSTCCLILVAVAVSVGAKAMAQERIGVASMVENQVEGVLDGTPRTLHVRDQIHFNEIIRTGTEGRTQLLFKDETILTLGPDSEMSLDSLVYDPATNTGEMAVEILVGAARFVSGSLPKNAYVVKTPTTSIGIRGTVFDLLVGSDGATTVILQEGSLDVQSIDTGATAQLKPGQASTVTRGAPPSPPAPPSAAIAKQVTAALGPAAQSGGAAETTSPAPTSSQSSETSTSTTTIDADALNSATDLLGSPGASGSHGTH